MQEKINPILDEASGAIKIAPLISFNTLVDTDMGLLNYVYNEYRNDKYFNFGLFNNYQKLIEKVYKRKEENPLYCIMRNGKDKKFLDECYKEFLDTKEEEILSYSITTQMKMVIYEFDNFSSNRIDPVILYYDDYQKEVLDGEDYLNDIKKIKYPISMRDRQYIDSFYIKTISEAEPFSKLSGKSFYFSSCGLNLDDEQKDLKYSDLLRQIILNNQFAIFDMYNFID